MQCFLMLDASVKLADGGEPEAVLRILDEALAQTNGRLKPVNKCRQPAAPEIDAPFS